MAYALRQELHFLINGMAQSVAVLSNSGVAASASGSPELLAPSSSAASTTSEQTPRVSLSAVEALLRLATPPPLAIPPLAVAEVMPELREPTEERGYSSKQACVKGEVCRQAALYYTSELLGEHTRTTTWEEVSLHWRTAVATAFAVLKTWRLLGASMLHSSGGGGVVDAAGTEASLSAESFFVQLTDTSDLTENGDLVRQRVEQVALTLFKGHCSTVPEQVWCEILRTARDAAAAVAQVPTLTSLTPEAIMLRTLLHCMSEGTLQDVSLSKPIPVIEDVERISSQLQDLNLAGDGVHEERRQRVAKVLSEASFLFLLKPYTTIWSRYVAESTL